MRTLTHIKYELLRLAVQRCYSHCDKAKSKRNPTHLVHVSVTVLFDTLEGECIVSVNYESHVCCWCHVRVGFKGVIFSRTLGDCSTQRDPGTSHCNSEAVVQRNSQLSSYSDMIITVNESFLSVMWRQYVT